MNRNYRASIKSPLFSLHKSYKPGNDPFGAYFGALGSARELNNGGIKGVDCLTITSISPPKPNFNDINNQMRRTQNFRISTVTQASSPSRAGERNASGIPRSRCSLADICTDEVIENKKPLMISPKIKVLREKFVKREDDKEQEKEKRREEVIRILKQQQNQKENLIKQLKSQQVLIEEEKSDSLKVVKKQKEQVSETEQRKIAIYFRYKTYSLIKLVEDKAKNNFLGSKSTKIIKPTQLGNIPLLKVPLESVSLEEASIIDEVWRLLKVAASTRNKYKYRDVVNYNKKLRETMKILSTNTSPKSQKYNLAINLDDETPTKPGKKSRSPAGDKASALGEFILRKKESPLAKIFVVIGAYPALRGALEERGWIENPDPSSKDFNLKWASKVEVKYESLKPYQYVNHFEKNTSLTTKVGLARNIRNLVWFENEDIDEFYPRCYDLNDVNDFDDFLQDFKFEQAIATLRLGKCKPSDISNEDYNLLKFKLCLALRVCEKRLKPFETIVYDQIKGESQLFTQEEWDLMSIQTLDKEILENPKYIKLTNFLKRCYGINFEEGNPSQTENTIFVQAEATLARLEKHFPQVSMNQGKNIWIVKPAGLSRGRGICCHNSLQNIFDHIKIKESEWVAQKYIENPLIIKNRKFDIRQWVLVTDWNPLTVWFYEECYIRFTAQDFNPEDLNNKFAHLTNNAIGRNAANFETSEIEGNMWDSNEFKSYLQELTGKDIFEDVIKPKMKNIVIKTLLSTHDMLDSRKNLFELYGYDFMIDENFKTWILEINSSPSMDYSTSITERLVKSVLSDCVKVVVDYSMCKGKNRKNVETGNFQCIYSGKVN